MKEVFLDVIIDGLKLLPFLFVSYLIIEIIEHKSSEKMEKILKKSGVFGPIIGSILGLVPQCGFSVTASNLYAGRVITIGTLIAVYLSTSDEAIPIFLAHPESINKLFPLLVIKFLIGLIAGIVIDYIYRKKHELKDDVEDLNEHIHHICKNCHCEKNLFLSTLKHTANTFVFILIVLLILNLAIYFIGEDNLSKVMLKGSIVQPFITSIIGLIPNCASSVLLAELYIEGTLSFGAIVSGLLTGAGIGIVVLFKINKDLKENLKILATVYGIGVFCGVLIQIIKIFI